MPKVIFGLDELGRVFLKTGLIVGGISAKKAGDWCFIPDLHNPTDVNEPCTACSDLEKHNVNSFVHGVALPELKKLTSCATGFDGFVLPPR